MSTRVRVRALPIALRLGAVGLGVVGFGIVAVGCGEDAPGTGTPGEAEGALPPRSAPEAPVVWRDRAVRLAELNGSGVVGDLTATLTDDAVILVIEAVGLPAPSDYRAYLYRGTCAADGTSSVTLNPIVGLANATGISTTVLEASDLPAHTPLAVRLLGARDAPLACGELTSGTD